MSDAGDDTVGRGSEAGGGAVPFPDLAQRCGLLIEQLEQLSIRVPEDSAIIGLAYDLVPRVTKLLREAVELMTAMEATYAPDEGDTTPESLEDIGRRISWEFAVRDLNNLAFFARTELRTAHDQLLGAATQRAPRMTVASLCESGLRRLRKALVSIESGLYEFEGREAPKREWLDLKVSLQIRRLYWNLRRETLGAPPRDGKTLEARLRSAIYRIVAFRELGIYPFLRVEDRVYLRQLLRRMVEWLNSESSDAITGRRIWDDLAAFAEVLYEISNREELQDHDRGLVNRIYRKLFGDGVRPARVPRSMYEDLRTLLGLDHQLDLLILDPDSHPLADWKAPLERLRETFRSEVAVPENGFIED